jgi:hypothetical protein
MSAWQAFDEDTAALGRQTEGLLVAVLQQLDDACYGDLSLDELPAVKPSRYATRPVSYQDHCQEWKDAFVHIRVTGTTLPTRETKNNTQEVVDTTTTTATGNEVGLDSTLESDADMSFDMTGMSISSANSTLESLGGHSSSRHSFSRGGRGEGGDEAEIVARMLGAPDTPYICASDQMQQLHVDATPIFAQPEGGEPEEVFAEHGVVEEYCASSQQPERGPKSASTSSVEAYVQAEVWEEVLDATWKQCAELFVPQMFFFIKQTHLVAAAKQAPIAYTSNVYSARSATSSRASLSFSEFSYDFDEEAGTTDYSDTGGSQAEVMQAAVSPQQQQATMSPTVRQPSLPQRFAPTAALKTSHHLSLHTGLPSSTRPYVQTRHVIPSNTKVNRYFFRHKTSKKGNKAAQKQPVNVSARQRTGGGGRGNLLRSSASTSKLKSNSQGGIRRQLESYLSSGAGSQLAPLNVRYVSPIRQTRGLQLQPRPRRKRPQTSDIYSRNWSLGGGKRGVKGGKKRTAYDDTHNRTQRLPAVFGHSYESINASKTRARQGRPRIRHTGAMVQRKPHPSSSQQRQYVVSKGNNGSQVQHRQQQQQQQQLQQYPTRIVGMDSTLLLAPLKKTITLPQIGARRKSLV